MRFEVKNFSVSREETEAKDSTDSNQKFHLENDSSTYDDSSRAISTQRNTFISRLLKLSSVLSLMNTSTANQHSLMT